MTAADIAVAVPPWAIPPVLALSVLGFLLRRLSLRNGWRPFFQDWWLGWAWMFAGGLIVMPALFVVVELVQLSHAATGAAASVTSASGG